MFRLNRNERSHWSGNGVHVESELVFMIGRNMHPLPYLCHDGRCWGSKDGRPLYYDDDHLSEYGNKLLVPMFKQVWAGR